MDLLSLALTLDDAALDQRRAGFTDPLNADGLHSKAFRGFDVKYVVVEKKNVLRSAAERLHDALKGVGVRFDSPGQMRHELVLEGGTKS